MIQLNQHNEKLRAHFESHFGILSNDKTSENISLDSIDRILRECLSIDEMREAGSFFTGQALASLLCKKFPYKITQNSIILDPTCGAGNLLIECSRQLEVKSGLLETLNEWGKILRGYDIHQSFIEACKLRLVIEALNRGAKKNCDLQSAFDALAHICVRDIMTIRSEDVSAITHIIMNPPFTLWESPTGSFWKNGKVNAAGIVFEHIVNISPNKCSFSMILPDVLRSGSRYSCWRSFASKNTFSKCEIFGRFNNKTDVDVFILYGKIERESAKDILWNSNRSSSPHKVLSDDFDICVGSLVAYRDPCSGNLYPYIHPKTAPAWSTLEEFHEFRYYSGRVYQPPFLVIRRTSSPADRYRAVATLIKGNAPVAVENHMLVVIPKKGGVKSCLKLMRILKSDATNDFLNNHIRLRHLTVEVLKKIPIL
ncbi:TPA: N-6 DNA methylase [Enterobacter roggenkampii]|uniref:N-6 DNA methylase n=1 Tax=Enterobacter roggenkampii TaxID=1812935 RepID=UPI002004F19B|nr:N-6 DNA methylase [Enterobacter roggenkampii]MCK7180022.1 SAM-dependent methyltransferase [Enterobacter roggenkampii]